jgi:anti-sigma factor RsiW
MIMREYEHPDWWDERIEDFVDGRLPADETERIESLRTQNRALARQIELAQAMRREFRAMADVECPAHVTRTVMRRVRADAVRRFVERARRTVTGFAARQLRPTLAVAMLIALIVVASRIGPGSARPEPAVAAALGDVKWTLAYLSDVSRQTGTTVRSRALDPLVVGPMQQAMNTFTDN